MLKDTNKKIYLLAILAFALAGVLIWFAFFVQLREIRRMSDDIQKEQLDSLVRQQRSQKILEMGKELGDVEMNEKEMNALLVDKENAVPFLKALEAIAAETNSSVKISVVNLSKMKSQAAKKPIVEDAEDEMSKKASKENEAQKAVSSQTGKQDFSNQMGFSVELSGEYRSFIDFLTKLENLSYLVRLYDFQLVPLAKTPVASTSQPLTPQEESKKIKANLTIGVYINAGK